MEASWLHKRLKREKAARFHAETILEEKSRELFFKNKELERLNQRLNANLEARDDQLNELKKEHFELFENSAVGIVLSQGEKILQTNSTFAQMLGYEKEELIGKTVSAISHKHDRGPSVDQTQKLNNREINGFSMQKRYERRNGSYFWASTHVSEILDVQGETKYSLAVIVNIHEQKIAENKLNQTVEQLEEINANLEGFAHIVSHDLKAPLTGINTVLGWMSHEALGSKMQGYMHQMKDRVTKMNALIEGIVSYSRVSQSQEERVLIDVSELIDEAIQLLQVPLHIGIEKQGQFPNLYVNKAKLTQVFSNLLDNAIRHNDKPQGIIRVGVREDADYYHFTVWDNGEGIDNQYFTRIFKMFNTLTQNGKNTGIGLSLVKKIIEELGGRISVDSQKGEYTQFEFTLSKSICIYGK
ncbi:sensor histidine kinase [Sediminicola luteus]|uniref:histidine kinase n=1 Tax=Sediminicola luteus TaxID=319238 RepID=A0A2A4G3M0_9FLAO|nr:PAS domain-containing sensor histidine kinase [Sediminicola luteus]PCE62560.1 hypothetical protein B7P33_18155 [Sediminicola luteus]